MPQCPLFLLALASIMTIKAERGESTFQDLHNLQAIKRYVQRHGDREANAACMIQVFHASAKQLRSAGRRGKQSQEVVEQIQLFEFVRNKLSMREEALAKLVETCKKRRTPLKKRRKTKSRDLEEVAAAASAQPPAQVPVDLEYVLRSNAHSSRCAGLGAQRFPRSVQRVM